MSPSTSLRAAFAAAALLAAFASSPAKAGPASTMGRDGNRYFIDAAGLASDFFQWSPDYPEYLAAHRGGGFLPGYPENGIETMDNTLRYGPAVMEIDIQRTRDGVLMLSHDPDLDRTTTGSGVIASQDWADIRDLKLRDNFGTITPFNVASLRAALAWGDDRTLFALDVKADAFVHEVVSLVEAMGAEDDVFLFADDVSQMRAVHTQNPDIHFALFMTPDNKDALIAAVKAAGIPLSRLTAFNVAVEPNPANFNDELHELGIVSIFGSFIPEWGLSSDDAVALYQSIFASGVDSISTNRIPDLGRALGYRELAGQGCARSTSSRAAACSS